MLLQGVCVTFVKKNALMYIFRKETHSETEGDVRTAKEEEKNVTESEEIVNHTGYERVYLPETDTSEEESLDSDSDSFTDF